MAGHEGRAAAAVVTPLPDGDFAVRPAPQPALGFEWIDPLLEPRWNEWVAEHDAATSFHTSEWARVLVECYRYTPRYAVLRSARGVQAILPMMEVSSFLTGRRGVSLPFSDECVPLLREGVNLGSIVGPVQELVRRRNWKYLELRGGAESAPGATQSAEFVLHRLNLAGSEEMQYGNLSASLRRNIRKGRQEQIEVHRFQTREAVEAYYRLHCQTRRRHGLPPQSLRFFALIHEHVIAPGRGLVYLARFEGRWISGAIFFQFGSKVLFKFAASDPAFRRLHANHLLIWEAIRHFRRLEMEEFSFGRTELDNEGLRRFKRSWGADEVPLRYYRVGNEDKPGRRPAAGRNRKISCTSVLRHMPIPLLRLIGALSYRHMG